MRRLLCALLLAAALSSTPAPAPARAHSPTIATFDLEDRGDGWVLRASFAQAAADAALRRELGSEVDMLPDAAYKAAIVRYLKAGVSVVADGAPVPLGGGGIRLGSHATDVQLLLPKMPADPQVLEITVACFSDAPAQHNLLRVRRIAAGGRAEEVFQEVLDAEDGWAAQVRLARP